MQEMIQHNTQNVLFICGGAFEGIDRIIANRINKPSIGFGANLKKESSDEKNELLKFVEPDDLIKYGLIPELVGRLPVITHMEELSKESLVRVLVEPKNSIVRQYNKLFSLDNIKLEFSEPSLIAIADRAYKKKTGARGLRNIVESLLLDIMFDAPSDSSVEKVIVDSSDDGKKLGIKVLKKDGEDIRWVC
jgi:ATP-dependent Clp protease ATP-binding subunit ClpX